RRFSLGPLRAASRCCRVEWVGGGVLTGFTPDGGPTPSWASWRRRRWAGSVRWGPVAAVGTSGAGLVRSSPDLAFVGLGDSLAQPVVQRRHRHGDQRGEGEHPHVVLFDPVSGVFLLARPAQRHAPARIDLDITDASLAHDVTWSCRAR